MPDWDYVRRELRRKGVILMLLWFEYKEAHPDGWDTSISASTARLVSTRSIWSCTKSTAPERSSSSTSPASVSPSTERDLETSPSTPSSSSKCLMASSSPSSRWLTTRSTWWRTWWSASWWSASSAGPATYSPRAEPRTLPVRA